MIVSLTPDGKAVFQRSIGSRVMAAAKPQDVRVYLDGEEVLATVADDRKGWVLAFDVARRDGARIELAVDPGSGWPVQRKRIGRVDIRIDGPLWDGD